VESLLTLFGKNAVYVVAAALAVTIALIVWAFRQGRPVEFWPPKIGSRPDRASAPLAAPLAATATGGTREEPASPRDAQLANIARVFEVRDAAQFYQAIASNYDQRNSVNLLATHMEVITRIDQLRRAKPALRVHDEDNPQRFDELFPA
jgi:hypothetical protein